MSFEDYLFLPVSFNGVALTPLFFQEKLSYIRQLCFFLHFFQQNGMLLQQAVRLLPPTPMLTGVAYDDFEVAVDGRRVS